MGCKIKRDINWMGLYDAILIKDNHIDYSGGISYAVEKA